MLEQSLWAIKISFKGSSCSLAWNILVDLSYIILPKVCRRIIKGKFIRSVLWGRCERRLDPRRAKKRSLISKVKTLCILLEKKMKKKRKYHPPKKKKNRTGLFSFLSRREAFDLEGKWLFQLLWSHNWWRFIPKDGTPPSTEYPTLGSICAYRVALSRLCKHKYAHLRLYRETILDFRPRILH